MEEVAKIFVITLSTIIEIIAAIVIAIALVRFIYCYVQSFLRKEQHISNAWLRVKFGSSLAISLELLLAADILITAIAPTWEEIGKLAAIVAIRTFLNYFLDKELRSLEKRDLNNVS